MNIANTIAQQLGGTGRLTVMTGAKQFVAIPNGLRFRIGRNSKGVGIVRIKLNHMDTYDIDFLTNRGNPKHSLNGIYCDQLVEIFEEYTGMYLTF